MSSAFALLFAIAGTLSGQALQIATDSLPGGTVGVAYFQQLPVTGGTCPLPGTATSAIDSGALPAGLTVTSPPGVKQWSIQGTPTASGTFSFKLHITWNYARTPFDQCFDNATKLLTMTVTTGQVPPPPPPPPPPPQTQTPLAVDRSQVSTIFHTGRFPGSEKVHVTSAGTSPIPFTVQAITNTGGSWLSVSPTSGITPAELSLSFSTGLAPGVYTGTVMVAPGSGNSVGIAVTLTVITDPITLLANPASFSFSSLAGGPIPAAQSLNVTVSGDNVLFQADVTAPPNGKWLSVNPSAAATKATLTVAVDPKTLTPGTYTGSITVRVPGVPNSSTTLPVTYTIQTAPLLPTITPNGVVNAANSSAATAPGTWVSIFGSNLSTTTRAWRDADFVNGKLPATLDGVSVTINGKAAPVAFVSPTQINVLGPDDTATGLVPVQVKTAAGTSDSVLVLQQTIAPALFQFLAGKTAYVAGTHADGTYVAGTALTQQGIAGTAAKPGETIAIYGTGFGTTQPPISATVLVPAPLLLANPQELRVRIGGMEAELAFAGLIGPGVYQFNVVVPQVPDGDQAIVAELRGLLTRSDVLVAVQH